MAVLTCRVGGWKKSTVVVVGRLTRLKPLVNAVSMFAWRSISRMHATCEHACRKRAKRASCCTEHCGHTDHEIKSKMRE